CLDFVNTGIGAERLTSYQRLVDWARAAGALDPAEAEFVLERWGTGSDAEEALATALQLRSHLHQLAASFAQGESIAPPAAIESINKLLRSRPGYLQLEQSGDDWAARWKVPLRRADDVLWRVVRSAAALLADDDGRLVKRCERAACALFFYDGTKNHRKRWCRMDVCGGAERAAAYYRRRKGNAV
ncbi:MAG TPA: ABATE domain-containing protein, partial [Longimicrobiales bacterium]|nr:ABATE domain-containing protein [Longimicrobiales bacterium]